MFRMDGTFPGSYIDVRITNTTSLILALGNNKNEVQPAILHPTSASRPHAQNPSIGNRLAYFSDARSVLEAPPITLLVELRKLEWILLPGAAGSVSVKNGDLNRGQSYRARIQAPMMDNDVGNILMFEGLWLSEGGRLVPAEAVSSGMTANSSQDEQAYAIFGPTIVIEKEDIRKAGILEGRKITQHHRGIVEVVTDSTHRHLRPDSRDVVSASWGSLLADMYDAEHVELTVDGACLINSCIDNTGAPPGLEQVYFRSGPFDSPYSEFSWPFETSNPNILILNLGASDHQSFNLYPDSHNMTAWKFHSHFEDTYVSFVKRIRQQAHAQPKLSSRALGAAKGSAAEAKRNTPVPILIMRPFRGELEHATQGVVKRLRDDGDMFVHWVDTSGWLGILENSTTADGDFYPDSGSNMKSTVTGNTQQRWRLTQAGNQKVAAYLHAHVCTHLEPDASKCPFQPQGVYEGSVYDPGSAAFNRWNEAEKARRLRVIFSDRERGL